MKMYAWAWSFIALENTTWGALKDQLWSYVADPALWIKIGTVIVKIIAIFIAGRIVNQITVKALDHIMAERDRSPLKFNPRRTKTLGKLVGNVINYTVNFIVIMMILNQLGFNLGPLLAGAGVIGLAVGFGAQSLVKDVITGFFIIFEDQFAVGDVIQTGNFKGTVEEIGIRVTRIRSWTGEVHIIPNGSITQVTNFSVNNSIAVVDVSVPYEADIDRVIELIKETVNAVYEENDKIVKEPEVLGVQTLSTTEVVIRITAECRPNTQTAVARQMNASIKKALDEHGIEITSQRMGSKA